ncbi:MAG: M48 family metalloprotease [Xanthobacteraceae bacterium]
MRSGRWSAARLMAVPALALWLGSCTSLERITTPVSLPDTAPKPAEATPTAREHNRILAAYGGAYQDARLEGLITQTVDRLVAASERPSLKYKVTILNSPAINAFALPNGQLYVTRGLLALANDTSELASVLSHEMSHVIARHAAIREDQAKQASLVKDTNTDLLNRPDMGAMALARSKIALATFSRQQELEADGVGVGISQRAGFDPYGAVRFLTAMGRNAELRAPANNGVDARFLDFLSSHPGTPDRLKIVRANARQYTAPGDVPRDKQSYLASIDGLPYGEDPSEGYVRGRRFLHPRLAFTFTAPDRFTLENTAQAVLGVRDNGNLALRFDVIRVPAEQTLSQYLGSGWIENVDEKTIEAFDINALPAATALAKGDQWMFRLYAIRFNDEVYRFIFAAKQMTSEADRAFRYSVSTFRRMTQSEIDSAKPLRLRIVTVTPGDTAERMAGRMPLVDRPLERFLILNGLSQGDPLTPGEKVKVVTE